MNLQSHLYCSERLSPPRRRTLALKALTLLTLLLLSHATHAAAPSNDNFASRISLGGSVSTTGSNVSATAETGEPTHHGNGGGKSVWWSWVAPSSGSIVINTEGSNYDTVLAIYTGTSVSALTFRASDDDNGTGQASLITFNAIAGTEYQIAVDGYQGETGNIVLNVNVAVVTVSATDAIATETGASTATFTIFRTTVNLGSTLVVDFSATGTATSASDYLALGSSATIPAGSSSVTVVVTPIDDAAPENTEIVTLSILATTRYSLGSPSAADASIFDNDKSTVTISAPDAAAAEAGADTGTFTFTRAGGNMTGALTVNYAISGSATNGSDYTLIAGSASIPAAQTAVSVIISPTDDLAYEGSESVTLTISASANYTTGSPSAATVTIADDDPQPVVTIAATDDAASETGPDGGLFTVTRTGDVSAAMTVNFTASGSASSGADYSGIGASVSIPAGQASATIAVTPVNDSNYEGPETVLLSLTAGLYAIGSPSAATVTIADDDLPAVTLSVTDASAGEAGPDNGAFTLSRTGNNSATLTVNFTVGGTAAEGVDFTALGIAATFAAGSATAALTVTPIDDAAQDPGETVVVTLAAGAGYTLGGSISGTVTINDDDTPSITIVPSDSSASEPGTDTGTFTLTRTASTALSLTVNYTVGGTASVGGDYAALSGSVTFSAGSSSAAITLTPANDAVQEPDETVVVTLSSGAGYILGAPNIATITIVDEDPPVNDAFANAALLSGALPLSGSGSNFRATRETGEPVHAANATGKSIWWTWTPAATGAALVTTSGSSIDTVLGVYTGASVSGLTTVAANDDASSSTTTSQVCFWAVAGTPYRIAVDSFTGAVGAITLSISSGPAVSIAASDASAGETANNGVFAITRTGSTSGSLTVMFELGGSADDYSDYATFGTSLVLGSGVATGFLTVVPVNDSLTEGSETVVVTLAGNSSYTIDPSAVSATVTIADNEPVVSGNVADTLFSPQRGFYSAPFNLAITTATSGATIRYTTDGTLPTTAAGTIYTGPLAIGQTSIIRAIAYKTGMAPTNVDTHTFIFVSDVINQSPTGVAPPGWPSSWGANVVDYGMDPNIVNDPLYSGTIQNDLKTLPSFSLVMKLDDLFNPSTGIYANPGQDGRDWERLCSLELIDPLGAKEFQVEAGVRLRGGYSRSTSNPKHALRFLFRGEYGDSKLNYPLFGPPPAAPSFDGFDLRTFQNYSWSFGGDSRGVFIRDVFSRDTQMALGHVSTRGDYNHLYINGQYWGLYNSEERPEASFGQSNFGGNKEDYDVIKVEAGPYAINATDGNMDAWTRLWKQCSAGLSSDAAYFKIQGRNPDGTVNPAYENLLDVDNMIDYMLVIYYGGNLDAPISAFLGNNSPNNFYGLRDRNGSAGFRFVVHDSEHTLLNVNESRIGPYPAGNTLNKSNPQWFFQQCQANAEFRLRVADHIRRHFFNGGALTPQACINRFMVRKNEIDRAVVGESARWGDSKREPPRNRNTDWVNEVNNIVNNYFPARSTIVFNQLMSAGLYPSVAAPTFSQYGGNIAAGFQLTITNPAAFGRIYYTTNGSDPRDVGGAIDGSAIDGGTTNTLVTLNATTTVKARILNAGTWSAMQESTFHAPDDYTVLKITEIMYSPPDVAEVNGSEFEFIEIKNTGAVPLNLGGASLSGGISFVFPGGVSIGAGQFAVLVSNSVQFESKYPGVPVAGTYAGRLSNSGEDISLLHSSGSAIISMTYNDAAPWPATADGLGFSFVPLSPNSNPDPSSAYNWRASTNAGGSPNADDPVNTRAAILVSEALTNSTLPAIDSIELYNPTAGSVDIGDWYLTDNRSDPKKYRIAAGTSLGAGQRIVFTETQFNPTPGVPPSFNLDSHGEEVWLFSADSAQNLTGYDHGFKFGAAANGVSFGRHTISTGEDHFPAQSALTFGAANAPPKTGPVVIHEIMYNPALGGDEFVELLNITSNPVQLFDPANPANAWQLGGLGFVFPLNLTIPADGMLLICSLDPAAFRTKYSVPAAVQIIGPYIGQLQDSGELLELQRPDVPYLDIDGNTLVPYVTIDAVRYNDKSPWPLAPDGNGPSLARSNPLTYGNDPANWQASSVNGGSPGSLSALPPAAPLNLTATASIGQIDLAWTDASNNESGFKLQRSPDGIGGWTEIVSLGANVTSYQNAGLPPLTSYYYRLYAHNGFGASAFTNTATASTPNLPSPSAPDGLTATAFSPTQIDLAWNDTSSDETGFKIESSPDGINDWFEFADVGANVTTFADAALIPLTTYHYRVRAYNTYGDSPYSDTASAATPLPPPPADPGALAAATFSNTQIDLAWADNSSDEDGFKIERSPDGIGGWTQIAVLGSGTAGHRDSGLTELTPYYYRVYAYHAYGQSGFSNTASATTFNIPPPATPAALSATAVSPLQIDLAWTDSSADETGFSLERSANGVSDWAQIAALPIDAVSYQNTALTPTTTYFYRVIAFNQGGPSAPSNVASDTTLTPPPPADPSGLSATALSFETIDLSWTDQSTDETGFKVERSADGTGGWTEVGALGAGANTFLDTRLETITPYYYRVYAYHSYGQSGFSNIASATTLQEPAPVAPANLAAVADSATRVSLSWTDASDNEVSFKVERSTDGVSWTLLATLAANSTSYQDSGLLPQTAYQYRVSSYRASGSFAVSSVSAATTQAQDFSALEITELMYNPPTAGAVDGDEFEFIELKNSGAETLHLGGVQFSAGITYVFPPGTTLAAGQFIVLASNPLEFQNKYPAVAIAGAYAAKLADSGETVTLADANGIAIVSFDYNNALPWPVVADGLGFSLVPRASPNPNASSSSNWRASTNRGGSPGADDPPAPQIAAILINEALTHTDAPLEDSVELYNPSGAAANIGGWFLSDDLSQPEKYRIPDGSTIPAGGYLVFSQSQFGGAFALSEYGEQIYLFSADGAGNLSGYAHGFSFGIAENGVSFGRYIISTGEVHYPAQSVRTLNSANAAPRVGPVVFNEIMYFPAAGGDEFIELRNITSAAVKLFDSAHPGNTWKIGGIGYIFPANTEIAAGGLLVISSIEPSAFRAKYALPESVQILGPYTGNMQDNGEALELLKPGVPDVDPVSGLTLVPYIVVEEVRYNDKLPWPISAAGLGPALERIDPAAYANDPANWRASASGISPGRMGANFPAAPTNLIAVAISNFQIALSWTDTATNESGFIVERSPNGTSNWTTIATLPANAITHTDGALTAATTYHYRVQAFNPDGNTLTTNVASATTSSGGGGLPPPSGDSDNDGLLDTEELALGTNPHDQNSKPGGSADFDGDGITDDFDPDDDNDGIGNVEEIAAGTNPFNAASVSKIAMQILKMQCSVKFDATGKDACAISGIIPGVPALFDPAGTTVLLDVGGGQISFTLDSKGRGKTAQGTFALSLKPSKRNPATKKVEFQGGPMTFSAKIRSVAWAEAWLDEGVDPLLTLKNAPLEFTIDLRFNSKVYTASVSGLLSSRAEKSAKFKK